MKLALVGNQNSGKTSLFNILTGANQEVGNWPGVTVNLIEKNIKKTNFKIVDLPGIYSLFSPNTDDEKVSSNFIFNEQFDLIINVVDANSLERNLYLTTQLMDMDIDMILVLNMYDLVIKNNIKFDVKILEKELGITVIPVSTKTYKGIEELKNIIFQKKFLKKKNKKIFPQCIEKFIDYCNVQQTDKKNSRFKAIKCLEEKNQKKINKNIKYKKQSIEKKYGMDAEQTIAYLRFEYIQNVKEKIHFSQSKKTNLTDKLDKFFLNKYLAIPFFLLVMMFIYYISISIVGMLIDKIPFSDFIDKTIHLSPIWLESFIKNILKTLFTINSFAIQLFTFFICLSIIETTGYMSRISLLFDGFFNYFGLSGKSIIPFMIGTGCSVPAIMNTCTIEDDDERKTTVALIPFIPCSAKMTIISFIASDFFSRKMNNLKFLFSFLFYVETILIILLILLIKKIFLNKKKQPINYIIEFPDYKKPNFKYVFRRAISKIWSFIKHDCTVMIFFSIVIWFLSSFDWKLNFISDINLSILSYIGRIFSPFFYLILGGKFCWAAGIVFFQGLFAKEQIVTTMKILGPDLFAFSPLTAFAFFTFNLFSIPCLNTLNAMKFEFKSIKKVLLIMLIELLIAWFIASFIGIWKLFL